MRVPVRYRVMLFTSSALMMWGPVALSESIPSPQEVLAGLAGAKTPEGILARKMTTPISFTMGPVGGSDLKYGSDVAFFKNLQSEITAFLQETLKDHYSNDAEARAIRVVVLFPDSQKTGDDAWLDKMFGFGDAVVRDTSQGDYYLMDCHSLVQNLEDPYNSQEPPADKWSIEMAAAGDVELTVRGTGYDKDALTRCLYRHIMAGLGLRGEIVTGQESVLASENPATRPTEFDRWLVGALYQWDASAGTEIGDAFPAQSSPAP